jgi:hypothetical protein
MVESHDDAPLGPGGHHQRIRHSVVDNGEAVIPGGGERAGYTDKQGAVIMDHL